MTDPQHKSSGQGTGSTDQGGGPDTNRDQDESVAQNLPGETPQGRTRDQSDTGDEVDKDLPSFTPQGGDY